MIHADLAGLVERVRDGVKGELVLAVEGAQDEEADAWQEEARTMLEEGMSVKDITSKLDGRAPKNQVKQFILRREKSKIYDIRNSGGKVNIGTRENILC